MATDNEFHQSDILSDRQHSQDVSISQILDHGSISFGRFSVETLAWEKHSVFRHNRCQEELEKYKSNGLVAQKKAYFEEYYKKIRALKVLQAEHQEATEPDLCPDGKINASQSENDNCDDLSQVTKSGNETIANLGSVVDKPVQLNFSDCNDSTNKVIVTEETSKTLSIELEHDRIGASLSPAPSVTRSLKSSQPDRPVSDPVKNDANKPKKHASPVLKSKGNAALPRNKPKLDCKVTRPRDDVKASEESRPHPPHHSTAKRDNNLLPSKCNTRSSATDNNFNHVSARKPLTEVCSSATVHLASTRSRLVSFSPSGRSHPKKETSNGKNLVDTLRTNPPVRSRSVQPSEQKSVPGGLKNIAIEKRSCTGVSRKPLDLGSEQMRPKVGLSENQRPKSMSCTGVSRKPLDLGSEQMRPKVGLSENQRPKSMSCIGVSRKPLDLGNQQMRPKVGLSESKRPKSMFTNKPTKNKANQNFGADYDRKNCGKERKQKEGDEESNTARRRYPKSAATVASSTRKNVKLVHKIAESSSGTLPYT
ncbi:hypothetical protein FF2_019686 [Malus domestica]